MKLVILESPYAGSVADNETYARACVRDSLERGEAPIASHLLYTQPGVLDDTDPDERAQGISSGLAWLKKADASVFYVDRGISDGMLQGMLNAQKWGVPIKLRKLKTKP